MGKVVKRPIVIEDLTELATYIADGSINISDNFLFAAEKTFVNLGNFPKLGKACSFKHPSLEGIRQKAIKGFENYLIFYRLIDGGVEILRVIQGSRDIKNILEADIDRDE